MKFFVFFAFIIHIKRIECLDDLILSNSLCSSGNRYVPYPNDCSKYILCDMNKQIFSVIQCPGVTLFNPQSNICDQPYNVNCNQLYFTSPIDDITQETTTQGEFDSLCFNSDESFVRHPIDCKKYIRCDRLKNTYIIVECPGDLIFNDSIKICDLPYRTECVTDTTSTTITTT